MSGKLFYVCLLILLAFHSAKSQFQTSELVKIADGVYGMIASEARMNPVESNSIFIIGSDYVTVFDTNRTPTASQAVIAEIRKLTDKPVRYVINSHWHEDHTSGNQSYLETFGKVDFIAHRNTREDMQNRTAKNMKTALDSYTTGIPRIEEMLKIGIKRDGSKLTEAERADYVKRLVVYKEFLQKLLPIRLVLPTITFDKSFTLYQDDREIQIMHFGRGNTRGDVVVYLPKEKVLLTGDLVVHPVPFAFSSYYEDWIKTMKELQKLETVAIVPGHGPIMQDKNHVILVTELLESLYKQVQDSIAKGMSLEETRKAINLDSFRDKMAGNDADRLATWNESIITSAINQVYKEIKGEPK